MINTRLKSVFREGRVLSSNRLKVMCRWMGSYHNRVTFSIELQKKWLKETPNIN